MSANPNLAVVFDPSAGWLEAVSDVLAESGLTVAGRASEAEQALTLVETHRPGLLVADPAGGGINLIRGASSKVPALKAIALGTLGDARLLNSAFAAGAAAFVVKTERFDSFGAAMRDLVGEPVVARARETTAA